MNPCIGDRQLDPDDEPECSVCNDSGWTNGDQRCTNCEQEWMIMSDPGEPNDDFDHDFPW